jgi:hypothetical protein
MGHRTQAKQRKCISCGASRGLPARSRPRRQSLPVWALRLSSCQPCLQPVVQSERRSFSFFFAGKSCGDAHPWARRTRPAKNSPQTRETGADHDQRETRSCKACESVACALSSPAPFCCRFFDCGGERALHDGRREESTGSRARRTVDARAPCLPRSRSIKADLHPAPSRRHAGFLAFSTHVLDAASPLTP